MSIIRVGTTKKYSEGWESAFKGKSKPKAAAPVATKAKPAPKSAKSKPAKAAVKKVALKKVAVKKVVVKKAAPKKKK